MNSKWFFSLLILSTLISVGAHFFTHSEPLKFATACLSLLFWAALLGKATENVAHYAGERLGGFLNATFGNAAELIIAIFLVQEGLFEMVKASITGSIIGNLLLVLGLSVFFGGLKYKIQRFNSMLARHNASLMLLSVIALFIPAAFMKGLEKSEVHTLSLVISSLLILGYFLWLLFSMITHKEELGEGIDGLPADEKKEIQRESGETPASGVVAAAEEESPDWSKGISLLLLIVSTAFVALQSEWLVGSVEAVAHTLGWSELFVGGFLIAIIGNAAEHSAAIFLAMKNRIGAAVEIAIGSSLQVALFVAPVLVFVSWLFGQPMDFVFTGYELAAIAVAAFIAKSISQDGSTNWFEGVLLLLVYIILGTAFFMV
ncbi:calcium/proton exchanger [Marinithermofilum abyssi]|uniref:Ca(2+)/H(+) antiporter n=1 Tax=Marinithermofilum abyssi TaxID=1571185 RepID=A0A8J2VI30_9BACL|nr:calcium/proton exchanger [Marinithermofilum abyssi]GGE19509.1 calcium/proton exchanger [Marinithermofilum abyssi]